MSALVAKPLCTCLLPVTNVAEGLSGSAKMHQHQLLSLDHQHCRVIKNCSVTVKVNNECINITRTHKGSCMIVHKVTSSQRQINTSNDTKSAQRGSKAQPQNSSQTFPTSPFNLMISENIIFKSIASKKSLLIILQINF